MDTVSNTHAAVNMPSSLDRARVLSGRKDATHVTVTKVRPNDSPKVVGLRSDNGPTQDAPLMTRIARWIRPLTINNTPTT